MNCNVTIDTQDLAAGRDIASAIRSRTPGGLPGIQAMAFPHKGHIEIACNVDSIQSPHQNCSESNNDETNSSGDLHEDAPIMLDYTTPDTLEQRVAELARKRQISLVGTALVGFRPEQAYQLAVEALETGQDQFWKTRAERMMWGLSYHMMSDFMTLTEFRIDFANSSLILVQLCKNVWLKM